MSEIKVGDRVKVYGAVHKDRHVLEYNGDVWTVGDEPDKFGMLTIGINYRVHVRQCEKVEEPPKPAEPEPKVGEWRCDAFKESLDVCARFSNRGTCGHAKVLRSTGWSPDERTGKARRKPTDLTSTEDAVLPLLDGFPDHKFGVKAIRSILRSGKSGEGARTAERRKS
jgi:hypothetical protein